MRGKNLIELLEQRRLLSLTMLKDIVTGAGGSYPVHFAQLNSSQVVFAARDGTGGSGTSGMQLWQTDGTAANTSRVISLSGGMELGGSIGVLNGYAYFFANDGTHGYELWKSGGTSQTTSLVDDINPGSASSAYYETPPLDPFGQPSNYPQVTAIGNHLFFRANDGTNGFSLWTSDGTTAGTKLLKNVGFDGKDNLMKFVNLNGTAYFRVASSDGSFNLWKSDGTTTGTTLVKAANGSQTFGDDFGVAGNYCFFSYLNGSTLQLWETDGTTTRLVPGADALSNPYGFMNINGLLYFGATSGGKTGLYTSNGTEVTLLTNSVAPTYYRNPDPLDYNTGWAAAARNFVLFYAKDPNTQGCSIWRTDGTPGGTSKVTDSPLDDVTMTSFNGNVYIAGSSTGSAGGLYRSDGTAAGTVQLKDSLGNTLGTYGLTVANNKLFFSAYTTNSGVEPYCITDDIAPLIYQSQANFNQAKHSIQFDFDENIGSTLSVSNFTVQKSGSSPIAASAMSLSYDASTAIATLTFPGLPNQELPDGEYSVTVSDAGVKDIAGNAMAASYTTSVEFLMGDANGDETVNALDFNVLATNYGKAGNFTQGDFDYSGTVGSNDFAILASQYGKSVAAPGGSMVAQSLSANPPQSLFANTSISQNLLLSDDSSVL